MLTDEELKYWEQYGMEETVSMAREILATRATVIEQQAEIERLREALEPFAKAADARRRKDIYGSVCFSQSHLLTARAALGATQ